MSEEKIDEHVSRIEQERRQAVNAWTARVLQSHGLPANVDRCEFKLHYDDGSWLQMNITRKA